MRDVIDAWPPTERCCVILVDEEDDPENKLNASRDRLETHINQAAILHRVALKSGGVFLVGAFLGDTEREPPPRPQWRNLWRPAPGRSKREEWIERYGDYLGNAIPSNALMFNKPPSETDAFNKKCSGADALIMACSSNSVRRVIIMGQSTNACCAATAYGAVRQLKDVTIHTCLAVLRGGLVHSGPIDVNKWPVKTIVHPWS